MHVIITGANRGIGLELAKIYEAQGCQVTKTSRKAMPGYATLDVNDPASHEAFAASLDEAPVDLYIANAGINIRNDESVDTGYAADEWAQTFQTNVTGVFLGIQSMLPAMRAAPAPKIAIISSQLASSTNSGTGMLTYRASKAAVLNLGRNLAKELAPEELAVGIFHPGWVVTDMGGAGADITVDVSASGLVGRIDALSLANTGIYEDYKGDALPY